MAAAPLPGSLRSSRSPRRCTSWWTGFSEDDVGREGSNIERGALFVGGEGSALVVLRPAVQRVEENHGTLNLK